jgi:Ca2+-binding EF-hand superfamily protein
MAKLGHQINEQELQEIFERYDIDKNGDITFEEFK